MDKLQIQQYLSKKIIEKINFYVQELDFDVDSILDVFAVEFSNYEKYMVEEITKYIMYVVWLKDKNKDLTNSFNKYLMRVEQLRQRIEIENHEKLQEELVAEKKRIDSFKEKQRQQERFDQFSNESWQKNNEAMEKLRQEELELAKQRELNKPAKPVVEEIIDFPQETIQEELTLFEIDDDDNITLSIENDVMTVMDEKEEYQDINLEEIIEKFNLDDEGLTLFDNKETNSTIFTNDETLNNTIQNDNKTGFNVDDYLSNEIDNDEVEEIIEEIQEELPTPISFDSTNETITNNEYEETATINIIDTMPEIIEEQLTIIDFNEEDNTIILSNNEEQQEYEVDELEAIDMLNHNLSNPFDENGDDNLNGEVELELVLDFNPKLGQIIAFNDSEYEICGMSVKIDQIGEETSIMLLKDLNTFEMIEVRFIKEI